jgi:hypothetical protein
MSKEAETPDPDVLIDTVAPLLGLTVTAAQRPGVTTFLKVAQSMAEVLQAAPLPDDNLDQAPVFRPGAPTRRSGD